jgi:hypothetical protein
MNKSKLALLSIVALCAVSVADIASARGYHRHHRSSVGIFIGAPLLFAPYYYPRYYGPRYYYPPSYYYPPAVVTAPASPPVYIEQNPPVESQAPTQSSGSYWYYCRDSQSYYPYVQQCASPWQQVVPQSAPPA